MAYDIMKAMEKWKLKETSRLATTNRDAKLRNDSNSSKDKEQERDNDPESNDENDSEEPENFLLKNHTSTTQTTTRTIWTTTASNAETNEKSLENFLKQKILKTNQWKWRKRNRGKPILLPSKDFRTETTIKSPNQSEQRKTKRLVKSREIYEPNFESTYKRKEATFLLEEEDDDLTDLGPTQQTFGQLLSCMEQNIGKESGKLNDPEEDPMKSLNDLGNRDPKS
jgi:hypothetical protein